MSMTVLCNYLQYYTYTYCLSAVYYFFSVFLQKKKKIKEDTHLKSGEKKDREHNAIQTAFYSTEHKESLCYDLQAQRKDGTRWAAIHVSAEF